MARALALCLGAAQAAHLPRIPLSLARVHAPLR